MYNAITHNKLYIDKKASEDYSLDTLYQTSVSSSFKRKPISKGFRWNNPFRAQFCLE